MVKREGSSKARFSDRGESLSSFFDRVLVRCPRCSAPGIVSRPEAASAAGLPGPPRFRCEACAKTLDGADGAWFGPARAHARRRCGGCGVWLEARLQRAKGASRPSSHALPCRPCDRATPAPLEWQPRSPREPHDPYFGLPMRLQVPCCGALLFALNEAHLAFLRRYVDAALRERRPHHNASLASRLPGWIKDKKNREAVLKGIERLEAELAG